MINNEFQLIGYALTDLVLESNDLFKRYTIKIEVEKTKDGQVFETQVVFYTTNGVVDFNEKLKGHLVVVSGYIDTNCDSQGRYFNRLVGLVVKVLDNIRKPIANFVESKQNLWNTESHQN